MELREAKAGGDLDGAGRKETFVFACLGIESVDEIGSKCLTKLR